MSHILIVDDNLKNIQVLGNTLRENDYEIAVATSGKEALEWVDTEKFDLILLDIMMPVMDGYEVCERIKANPEIADIPIIFLTAKTEKDSIVKGFELGAVDYVTKPFNSAELLSRVKTHIDLKNARERLEIAYSRLDKEKEKSDKLLLTILNEKIVKDLKETGESKPEVYDNVTIFFSDLVGFTTISEQLEPDVLISELNELFAEFDKIMQKNECERMENIGDAYLAACGIPKPDKDHAEKMILASMDIVTYMKTRNLDAEAKNKVPWKIRIGLHTGKVAGGIVGTHRIAFNVFGDTVNTASRMETYSEPMRINVSELTYNIVKHKFSFIERNPVDVKGKGMMKMFFLGEG